MKDYQKDEFRLKWSQMDPVKKKRLATAVTVVGVILFFISPVFAFVIIAIFIGLYFTYYGSSKEKLKEDLRSIGFATADDIIKKIPMDTNSSYTEADIDTKEAARIHDMNVPPVVKHKLIQFIADNGGTLEDILDNPEVPDVLKRYVSQHLESGGISDKPVGFDVGVSLSSKNKAEDDLYNPEEYESANVDLSNLSGDMMFVNGKPVDFKNKKNPFEM